MPYAADIVILFRLKSQHGVKFLGVGANAPHPQKLYAVKGFITCEGKLGMGGFTPFVIMFSDIVAEAAERIMSLLSEGRENLFKYENAAARISDVADSKNLFRLTSILIQATLFSDYVVTMSGLAEALQTSKQTPYRYLKVLEGMGLIEKKKIGKEVFHTTNLERLLELLDAQY